MNILRSGRRAQPPSLCLLLLAASISATAQTPQAAVRKDLAACHIHEVTGLPGSHLFAADFIEALATDPDSNSTARDRNSVWALTADLNTRVPRSQRALYLSRSTDGGASWTQLARIAPQYFNARIAEGLRNGLAVSPGGRDFVITTQKGAFQVIPQLDPAAPIIKPIPGPRVLHQRPGDITITKKEGDPVRAGVVLITADGHRMVIAYGYFDDNPQLFLYRRDRNGTWSANGTLPHLPTDLDIFSMQFDDPAAPRPHSLYVGTGDQAYRLNLRAGKWTRITGVGPDSAIHSISTTAGLHLAACWGIYNPVSPHNPDAVTRVTTARFLLHRGKDQVGPNIRAYGIAVDPARPNREVLTAITGVYTSRDSGQTWKRINELPEGEFHSAHFNPDGSILVSGYLGTFLANPFSAACSPHLHTREQ